MYLQRQAGAAALARLDLPEGPFLLQQRLLAADFARFEGFQVSGGEG
ncbi:hypothetical protein [Pseudomonas sp. MWU13-2100]|nr:hypothetical protein [Pseudomonas sp. MWU13-2100]